MFVRFLKKSRNLKRVGSREAGPKGRPAFAEAASRRQAKVAPTPFR
jgi:hypothetical protein